MRVTLVVLLALASLVVCVFTAAVAQPGAAPGAPAVAPTPQPAAAPPAVPVSPEDQARRAKVIAKVGPVTITVGDIEDDINQRSVFMRTRYRDPEEVKKLVEEMVRFELLAAEAEHRGYGRDREVVKNLKQNSVQHFLRVEIDEKVTMESIPAEDVKAYYDAHPEEFHREEMIRASHILLADRAAAEKLVKEARGADTQRFRALAREQSVDDQTRLRGGDLRYFGRDGKAPGIQEVTVPPEIVTAAFALREIGDLSRPVQVAGRWSVVRLTGRRPAEHRTIEDADRAIRLRLWRERKQKASDDRVEEARRRFSPEVHADLLAAIRLDPPPADEANKGMPPGFPPMKAGPGGMPLKAHPLGGPADDEQGEAPPH